MTKRMLEFYGGFLDGTRLDVMQRKALPRTLHVAIMGAPVDEPEDIMGNPVLYLTSLYAYKRDRARDAGGAEAYSIASAL